MFDLEVEEEEVSFTINTDYAKRFEHNKKREELHRLQEKYGKDATAANEDSSDETDEDDDAIYDSIAKDKGFLRVLSKIKSRDPEIYDKSKHWFHPENGEEEGKGKEKAVKPVFLKDYERQTLLTKGSLVIDSDEDDAPAPTYTEEQEAARRELKDALTSGTAAGEDAEPLLTLRSKTAEEKEKEEEDYREWLKGERKKISDPALRSDCEFLKQTWSDPNLDENERFLRDFILNKGWVDSSEKDFVPTYDEIVDDDEEEEERQELFERKFNFRFEEPDHDLIKNYPRTIANSVRKEKESRKDKRKRKDERKKKEKEERQQEIDRLKKLKLEEIEGKLAKLSSNAGKELKGLDLEGDFDPDRHDQTMSTLFDEEYYQVEETKRPVFSDSEDDLINDEEWFNRIQESNAAEDNAAAKKKVAAAAAVSDQPTEDTPHIIYREDEAEKGEEDEEEERSKKRSWKRKRSKKFKEAVTKQKPVFNPDEGPFERYFDEYYALDCEDTVGEVKCRFGYRKAEPCSYGLTVDEILRADDKELNQWYSFKKMMKYRTRDQESRDLRKFGNTKRNEYMKRQILKSLYEEEPKPEPLQIENLPAEPSSSAVGEKKKRVAGESLGKEGESKSAASTSGEKNSKKRKSKGKTALSESRLAAYGLS